MREERTFWRLWEVVQTVIGFLLIVISLVTVIVISVLW